MNTVTQRLRDEHKELLPHLEHILALADQIQEGTDSTLVDRVAKLHGSLAEDLLHHAHVEEQALYPVIAGAMGAPEATATMSRDHVEIGQLVTELGTLSSQLLGDTVNHRQANELRRLLYGLHAVVRLHFLKEEEVYLPLLDTRLTEAEATALMEALGKAEAAG